LCRCYCEAGATDIRVTVGSVGVPEPVPRGFEERPAWSAVRLLEPCGRRSGPLLLIPHLGSIIAVSRDDRFLPISQYGIIGNLYTVALVGSNGSIDWSCFPRVDSPSVFGALLDPARGGRFRIRPVDVIRTSQRYDGPTNVLVTEFETASGARVELTDFMPAPETGKGGLPVYHEIHRRVRVLAGVADVRVRVSPRFDYGRTHTGIQPRRHGLLFCDDDRESLALVASPSIDWFVDSSGAEARGRVVLRDGEEAWFVARFDDDEVMPIARYHSELKLEATHRFWTAWARTIRYEGPYRDAVLRSALVLKLLFYSPSGAVVAAATTSLPEGFGGGRNWDYRYVWLRDAAFTLGALGKLGYTAEADHFMDYLKRITRKSVGPLQIMYGVEGERRLAEETLNHLSGYRGSRPVRIGNGAYGQVQTDVYGEVLDAIYLWSRSHEITEGLWGVICRLANWVAQNWTQRDSGIWEHRSGRQHFVFSKIMCWVALDRALRISEEFGLSSPSVDLWEREREAIRREVFERGWKPGKHAFSQHYGTDDLDAALLLVPQLGFLPATDLRMRSTVAAIRRELCSEDGFVFRYRNGDGLAGEEGVFSICTLWLADALILDGEVEAGEEIFRRMLARASPLGLYSEEFEPRTGEFLGNYPQAYTHVALINTAFLLEQAKQKGSSAREPPLLEVTASRLMQGT
jgi:GH15 family glucan-1,4-alpha-glucosidase